MPILSVTGIDAAIKFNDRISDKKNHIKVIEQITLDALTAIRYKCPIDTGLLLSTIKSIKLEDGILITVGNEKTPYVIFMEYGFSGFNIGTIEQPIFKKSGFHPFIRSSIWEINLNYSQYIKNILFNIKT